MQGERLWWISTSEKTANLDHNQCVDWDPFEQQVHVSQHLPGIFTNASPSVLHWAQPQLPKNVKTANSVKQKSRSSSNTSQAGWEENLDSVCKLDIGQRALNTVGCGGTCRRNMGGLLSDFYSVDSARVRKSLTVCDISSSYELGNPPSRPTFSTEVWCLNQPLLALDIDRMVQLRWSSWIPL